jgi:hypothetical protein
MKKKSIIVISALFVVAIGLLALKLESKTYEYVYIIQTYETLKTIDQNNITTTKLNLDYRYIDFRPALKKIHEMETEGWEVYENSIVCTTNNPPQILCLMRKSE